MIRSLFLFPALAGYFCGPNSATAGDYSAAYVIQLRNFQANGVLKDREFLSLCEVKLEEDKGTIRVTLAPNGDGTVTVSAKSGCCLFADGTRAANVKLTPSIQHFDIYSARERRKNEYVPNAKIGDIYISLSR